MSFPGTGKIWMNGSLVEWKDAKIHIASHVVHYGSGVFEGARCYDTRQGPACFRLDAHLRRLVDSSRIYRMEIPYDQPALANAVIETIQANGFRACYIRPLVYRGYDTLGVHAGACPIDVAILVWEWGAYFTKDAIEEGLDVKVSTWVRNAPNTTPAMAKSVANYANAQLIKMEAVTDGYAEGIALDTTGNISEGSGQNVFIVRDGVVYTPPIASSVLWGITRDSAMTIARDLGFEVREQTMPRETLYLAEEVFFVGTAVEVTPIRSVDRITVGRGRRGPVTEAIQQRFFQIVRGEAPDTHGWLQYVHAAASTTSGGGSRR
ncbi:MAG: branched chain amino acid aminotransferase [Acidobacteria bacterium RIFCSPLOWO2_02_FULL_68_18]|nr:MAG: branched chain amino acid aminotransferase [Acidobacteria bacterium RIFCSPLOWO2_02_FULL_68_18]OFW49999.1 MAG: branched chain amino acid aminotransferase [Acidobacteria bacterium RIFCSPLOWO2_12_FULL_68_19]